MKRVEAEAKRNNEDDGKTIEMEQQEEGGFGAKDPSKKSRADVKEETEQQEFYLDYQREHSIAYLYKKMPYNYMVIKRILNEVRQRMPKDFKPESILDYGSGLGSGLWAA